MRAFLRQTTVFFVGAALLSLGLSCLARGAYAQSVATSDEPIYVVDMQRVFSESIAGKAANNNFQEELKKKRVVLEKQRLEIDKLKQELEKQASLLSESALQTKQDQLMKKSRDFERAVQDHREEMTVKNRELMEKVVKNIHESISEVASKNNYKLILEKDLRVIIYANSQYDISDEVIKLMNEKHVGL